MHLITTGITYLVDRMYYAVACKTYDNDIQFKILVHFRARIFLCQQDSFTFDN